MRPGLPSDMVAVGSKNGPNAALTAVSQFGVRANMMPTWKVREGRGNSFALWEDALDDLLPTLGLRRDQIAEAPPTQPIRSSLDVDSLSLWKAAVDQYQREGTLLFDAVRPSIDIEGPYAMQDLRRISAWKRDGIKDGRALVRWALSFADRSSLSQQMQLVADINSKKLDAKTSVFGLSEHLLNLWEMWLALENSTRDAPAAFFRQLLVSMPTEPECPVVHVRRYLVDLLEQGSPLLGDIDGEHGLFKRMETYGASLGMKEKEPARLTVLQTAAGAPAGAPEGGGEEQAEDANAGMLQLIRLPWV